MSDGRNTADVADEFGGIETLLREITPADTERTAPPADLWDRIEAEVGSGTGTSGKSAESENDEGNVISLDQRRFPKWAVAVTAVAAAAFAFAGVTAISGLGDDDSDTMVVASAELAYDPVNFDELGATAAANVTLVDDGQTTLISVDEAELPTPTGESADLELWLIEPDADGNVADLVSLGLLDPTDPGEFPVPDGYDPDAYFVVDISVEPRDGDEAHSGRSILRGPLTDI